jgi:class 3 adenylate cyclase
MNITPIETRLAGSARSRFFLELFGNSAQFPIANILLEMLLEGARDYLRAPDLYSILFAALTQAFFLSRWQVTPTRRRFWGNLIGPAVYTAIEFTIEGAPFFARPHHIAYWIFAFIIGALQFIRPHLRGWLNALALILEDVTRANILLVMYALLEGFTNPKYTSPLAFIGDTTHQFVIFAIPLLGLIAGLATLTAQRYLDLLKQTLAQLRMYSEWLLGRDLLNRLVTDPNSLTMTRRERTVLFMDIRGFTRWSESRSPEEVVAMLDRYYHIVEEVLATHPAIKFKFAADEAMAIYAAALGAADSARELQSQVSRLLAAENLGAGIGLHTGAVVEGLLGSAGVKFYDVIGDTVNTAKRIEGNASAGEILISDAAKKSLPDETRVGAPREITAKGKEGAMMVYLLL